jgi:hypothetical protein
MTTMPKHPVRAAALLGAAALALPALAQGGGGTTHRHGAPGAGMMGGMMDRGLMRQGMSEGCSQMMQGMRDGEHGGRPNQQWRRPLPAPDRG